MSIEIKAKLIAKLETQSGTSARGNWSRQDAIFETEEQYPKKVCVSFWGEKVAELEKLSLGDNATVSINIDSRESNGKWFTSVRAWRVQTEEKTNAETRKMPNNTDSNNFLSTPDEIDDLPF